MGRDNPVLNAQNGFLTADYFKTSPEIIRLAVMMYVRFPLSLRQAEDLRRYQLEMRSRGASTTGMMRLPAKLIRTGAVCRTL